MSLVITFYFTSSMLNMFRTLIHPSSGAATFLLNHPIGRVFLFRCVLEFRCGWVGVVSVWQAEAQPIKHHGIHTYTRSPDHVYNPFLHTKTPRLSQLTGFPLLLQCRTPYAVIHGLVLLMMGIMMPETCWDKSLTINIGLVASCWFISLHPTFHDARSQEPNIYVFLLLCVFPSRYSVSLCCSVNCLCINVYCTTATGCQYNCT